MKSKAVTFVQDETNQYNHRRRSDLRATDVSIIVIEDKSIPECLLPNPPVEKKNIDPVYKVPIDENGDLLVEEPPVTPLTVIPTKIKQDPEIPKVEIRKIPYTSEVVTTLKSYDEGARLKKFRSEMFECLVCFSAKTGKDCLQFVGCEHVFCNKCMKMHFKTKIEDGEMNSLTCPELKCDTKALPKQARVKLFYKYTHTTLSF